MEVRYHVFMDELNRYRRPRPNWTSANCVIAVVVLFIWMGAASVCAQSSSVAQSDGIITVAELPQILPSPAEATYPMRVQLRIAWGGPESRRWSGWIRMAQGEFQAIEPLGLTPDTPGTIQPFDGDLRVLQLTGARYWGVDATVDCEMESVIQVEMDDDDELTPPVSLSIPLRDVLHQARSFAIHGESTLTVQRRPGDFLQVEFSRPHLVFETGERFEFLVRPAWTNLPGGTARMEIEVVAARTSRPVLSTNRIATRIDAEGAAPSETIELNLPADEGVYDIRIRLTPDRGFGNSLVSHAPSVERVIQVVALSRNPRRRGTTHEWRLLRTLDLSESGNGRSLAWSPFPRLGGHRLESRRSSGVRQVRVDGDRLAEIPPGGWQLVPLSDLPQNGPVQLQLDYPANAQQHIGLDVLQMTDTGELLPHGSDHGVDTTTPSLDRVSTAGKAIHRFTFWPATKQAFLLVSNRDERSSARVGTLKVFAGPAMLPRNTVGLPVDNRQNLAMIEHPAFTELVGASQYRDPVLNQSIDDWVTFYEGADRLIQLIKARGQRGAFLTVMTDGGSLSPVSPAGSNPRLDTGVFSSRGADPVRKDVVELLLRMFQREGLRLIPTLRFNGTIPEVERQRANLETTHEFELINYRQERQSVGSQPRLPRYNPLDPRVQNSLTQIVAAFANRYQRFESLGGIALICAPETCTHLPGRHWIYDSATRNRFFATQGDLSPVPTDWSEQQSLLLGQRNQAWMQWRATRLQFWYDAMSQALEQSWNKPRLFLAPVDLFRTQELQSWIAPSLHRTIEIDEVMLRLGFDADYFRTHKNIALMRPVRSVAGSSIVANRGEWSLDTSGALDDWFERAGADVSLINSPAEWVSLSPIGQLDEFKSVEGPVVRLQSAVPSSANLPALAARQVARLDAKWIVDARPLIVDTSRTPLNEFQRVFARLPAVDFDDVPCAAQHGRYPPVSVRQVQWQGERLFYLVNNSPWQTVVQLKRPSNHPAPLQWLESTNAKWDAAQLQLEVKLAPWQIVAGRVPDDAWGWSEFDYVIDQQAFAQLKQHYFGLRARLVVAAQPIPTQQVYNPGFNQPGDPLAGWTTNLQGALQPLVNANPGAASGLRIQSDGPSVWLRSHPFPAPKTGRLSISVWLRCDDPAQQPPLRICVEGTSAGLPYYRFGEIGGLVDSSMNRVETEWKRFAVHFDDLPLEPDAILRVGVDLMGAGTVYVDRIETCDRWFDENDVKVLTQTLAGAGTLMGRIHGLDHARHLMLNYWLVFLEQHVDLPQDRTIDATSQSRTAESSGSNLAERNSSEPAERASRRWTAPRWFPFR